MWKAKGGNMFSRRKHSMPVLNTTSTADISFMLLIFFLVTTSMDIDKGLSRQLPPLDDEKEEQVIDSSNPAASSTAGDGFRGALS